MTLYVGETIRISTSATDYDGDPIVNVDVTSATVEVQRSDGEEALAETAMSWDGDDNEWYYDWDTDDLEVGTYIAKCRIVGLSLDSWEFKTFRLNRNRF
jgi:hypothetical protein